MKKSDNTNEEPEQANRTVKTLDKNEDRMLNQVPIKLHIAQQEINNLRLLNICLQSTLIRAQTQLIEYLPVNNQDEIKRNQTKQKLVFLRQTDDHNRRTIHSQQFSFVQLINNFKSLVDLKQEKISTKDISLSTNEKQIDILHEMFHELNTIIHTEHNDRICQLYITLAEASRSVVEAHKSKTINRLIC